MDYSNLGLDSNLRSVNSPASGTTVQAVQFDTNYQIPTGYIDHANIKDFNFSQGSGGTLTLGGTVNGDGILNVNNAAGSPVVQLNNTGITVNNGSITINNSSGSSILDASGIVSSSNFSIYGTSPTSVGTISGTAFTDLADTSLILTLSRSARIICFLNVQASCRDTTSGVSGGNGRFFYWINVGGTVMYPGILFDGFSGTDSTDRENTNRKSYSTSITTTVAAGTTTIKAQGQLTGATNMDGAYYDRGLSCVVLGT